MSRRYPDFPLDAWIRTCQECGNKQVAKSPDGQKTDNWRELKCKRCKSEAMDYGSINRDYSDEEEND